MPSFLETLKESFVPPADVDPAVEAALDAVHSAEERLPKLRARTTAAEAALRDARAAMNEAALGVVEGTTTQKDYDALAAKVKNAEAALDLASQAETGAMGKVAEARRAMHDIGVAGQIKTQKRISGQRIKAATRLTAAIAEYASAFEELAALGNKNALCWPSVIELPRGVGLDMESLQEMVIRELCRHAKFDGMHEPDLPGAVYQPLSGDPKKYKSLPDVIAEANNYLLASIAAPPGAVAPVASPASAKPDPDGLDDQPAAKLEVINLNPTEFPSPDRSRKIYGKPDPRLGEVL